MDENQNMKQKTKLKMDENKKKKTTESNKKYDKTKFEPKSNYYNICEK